MNSKSYSSFIHLLGYVVAALAVVQLVLMFLPYYAGEMTNSDTGEVVQISASIQSFTWVRFEDFEEHFQNLIGESYYINNYITGPISTLVATLLTIWYSIKGVHKPMAMLAGIVTGFGGLICFLLTPLLLYGNMVIYVLCLVTLAAMGILSVTNLVLFVLDARSRIKV